MRGATDCAKRLKKLFQSLRNKLGKVQRPTVGDPITQLVLGVLTRDAQEPKAREALERMQMMVVDYNELRVIPPTEVAKAMGDYPDAYIKSEDINRALNRIFAIEHQVSLDRFATAPLKDVNTFLDRIDGLEAYTRARIKLLGLRKHAIPLDEAMWAMARAEEIVDGECSLEEAQGFLERQVAEGDDALDFVALLRKQAWTEYANQVRKRSVEAIKSVPPNRTSSNMLAVLASGGTLDEPALDLDETVEFGELEGGRVLAPEESPDAAKGAKAKPAKGGKSPAKPAKSKVEAKSEAKGADRKKPARSASEKTAPAGRTVKTPKSAKSAV